ncbi:hypothetical protein KsCSTR_25020 [Candidatus Kuenenia stuttgartiensis]|uniref:Uncharacterized protein n=3 Tax=Candidatus Kuenenia TaxID=380738 RepID=Q1Q427_KUEST|nr:hypothetical protein KsCSTR_25020 [Candidatus Kuenenia stuttgartiensis]CAJ74766.1 unknown protein [Candidatus Kuenenia stuttgartiensis]
MRRQRNISCSVPVYPRLRVFCPVLKHITFYHFFPERRHLMCMDKGCYLPPGVYYVRGENRCMFDSLLHDWESPDVIKNIPMPPFVVSEKSGRDK